MRLKPTGSRVRSGAVGWEERDKRPLIGEGLRPGRGPVGREVCPVVEPLSGGQGGQGAVQAKATSGTFPSCPSVLLVPYTLPLATDTLCDLGQVV